MELYDCASAPSRADNWFVYELVDPRSPDVVRYVGITNDPRRRLHHHLKCRDAHTRKSRWIVALLRGGLEPRMKIVADQLSHDEAKRLEVRLIARRLRLGAPLTNLTAGGDGTSGRHCSLDTRAKLALARLGRPLSDETKAKLSVIFTGRQSPNFGKALPMEWREAIRRAGRDRMRDPEVRERIAEAGRARYSRRQERERTAIVAHKAGPQVNSKTGLKGVSFCNRTKKWVAQIKADGRKRMIGRYTSAEDAARAYDDAARSAWGTDCYLNFPT